MTGAEGDKRFEGDLGGAAVGGIVGKAEALGKESDDDGEFHHGEGLADAFSGTAAEGKVGVGREAIGETVEPTLGAEFFGCVKVARIAMKNPLGHEECGAAREVIAAESHGLVGSALDDVSGGKEAEGFVEDSVEIGELANLVDGGRGAVEDRVELGVEFLFDARVLRKQVPGPAKGDGSSFVTGDEKGHDFVAELFGVHAAALVVGGGHEQGEQVGLMRVAVGESLAARFDDFVNE